MPAEQFIRFLKNADTLWSPSTVALDDPTWALEWENATTSQRKNIAHGWLEIFCFQLDSAIDVTTNNNSKRIKRMNTWAEHADWIKKLIPYVREDFFVAEGLSSAKDILALMLPNTTLTNPYLHKMMVGNKKEQITALEDLVSLGKDLTYMHCDYSLILPALAWSVANSFPEDNVAQGLACAFSYINGFCSGWYTQHYKNEHQRLWQNMGANDAPGNSSKSRHYKERTAVEVNELLKTTNELSLLTTLTHILLYSLHEVKTNEQYLELDSALGWAARLNAPFNNATEIVDAHVYEVLCLYLPSHMTLWKTAHSLELDYLQTCTDLLTVGGKIENNSENTALLKTVEQITPI